ncbi:hypothetical protein JL107_11585 [Nakamurella flavida]|uniref:CBM6 domain-containing protein n=1 Tax=Nakamurella flavida TaxID=363630 RepID=A0A939C2Z2_9ACTN|nr:hypothetical protein [Nakamurella flavida]MBM9477090.1 hypothetical protein [Nakamurella flavida]MDP9780036.1 hypothetical protein [Nakamurella flavida]
MPVRPAVGLLVALTVLASTATPVSATPPPAATVAAVAAAPGSAGHDYATDVLGDPMDYSNSDDMLLDPGPAGSMSNLRMQDGVVRGRVGEAGYLSPLWPGYGGSVLLGRDGAAPQNQLNADRYRTVSFSAYADRDVSAGLFWFACPGGGVSNTCGGGLPFALRAGWHTYQLSPGASVFSGWPVAWRGSLTGLRLAASPGAGGAEIALDWFRVVEPGSGAEQNWTNPDGGSADILWDADPSSDNNTGDRPGWGVLTTSSARSGTVDLSVLPAGSYRIGVRTSRSTQWTVVYLDAPLPAVLTPNAVGDRDFATDVLGNPWDMNGPDDVAAIGNATAVSYAGGRLSATNTRGPGDPYVLFPTGRGLDSRVYRNLTVTSGYDGGFDLSGNPGGGSMARVVWARPGSANPGSTDDILTYSGTRTVSVDLGAADNVLLEPDTPNNYSFASAAPASAFRWDPNEDPGTRRWWVDDVQLRSDFATTGTFPITWQDNAFRPGGTARIVADTDRSGCNGVTVTGGSPVAQGVNTTSWNTAGVPAGRYWLCLTITRGATSTSAYAGGVLVVGSGGAGAAPPARNPVGSLDIASLAGTTYTVAGWTLDQDDPARSLSVDVYDTRPDGSRVGVRLTADGDRSDIAAAYPGAGGRHAYANAFRLPGAGRHQVCVFGINVGSGDNTLLGCRDVDVPGPDGSVDGAASDRVGLLSVAGWAADPDAPAAAEDVHVYVSGPAGTRGTALRTGQPRDDVARVVPFAGPRSGWQGSVPAMGEGVNQVCAFAINVNAPRNNPPLGCRSVTVRNDFGSLDVVAVNGSTATAGGWAINPNRPGEPAEIHVYDQGPSGTRGYPGFVAGGNRADLAGFGFGTAHGYLATIPLTGRGKHTVCAYAITTGGGVGNTQLGCRDVTVN